MKTACCALLFLVTAVGAQQTRFVRTYGNPYLFRLQRGTLPQTSLTRVAPGGLRRVVSLGDDNNMFSPMRRSALLVRRRPLVRRLNLGRPLMTSMNDDDDNLRFLRIRRPLVRRQSLGRPIRTPYDDDDDYSRLFGSRRLMTLGQNRRSIFPGTIRSTRRSIYSPRRIFGDDNDDFDDLFRFNRQVPLTLGTRRRSLSPLRFGSLNDDYDDILRPFSRSTRGRVSPMRGFSVDDDDDNVLRFNRPFSSALGNRRSILSPMRGFGDSFDDLDDGFNLNMPSTTMGSRRSFSPLMGSLNDNIDDDNLFNPFRRSMSMGGLRSMSSPLSFGGDDDRNSLFNSGFSSSSSTVGNVASSFNSIDDYDDGWNLFSGRTGFMPTLGSSSVSSSTGTSLLNNDLDDNSLESFKIF
ncbi:uncharacterized protein LOC134234154 [Saccostrea cucullata]|uniref:uncharacterized protein LOC134234154 n=1 Tax=Saccostrea cuccullata TaxID=36930 RepID=UPI002ED22DEC